MLLIVSDNTNVYFNLAAEDYLLHRFSEDILMLWQSSAAVVCGKHQNLCAEINYGYCRDHGISPARRLTGGGTVFHDSGNVNFTFIRNIPEGIEYAVDYRRFLEPVREALLSMDICTEYSSRNDLLLNGKKISGNAEHVLHKTKRVLHHGTLLFSSDLHALGQTLRPEGIFTDKAVKSVRSEVTNIAMHLDRQMSVQNFIRGIENHFIQQKHTNRYVFSDADLLEIDRIRFQKYETAEWIIGYSPSYKVERQIPSKSGLIHLSMSVSKGRIESVSLSGSQDIQMLQHLEKLLVRQHLTEELSQKFAEIVFPDSPLNQKFILF